MCGGGMVALELQASRKGVPFIFSPENFPSRRFVSVVGGRRPKMKSKFRNFGGKLHPILSYASYFSLLESVNFG